jgi:membrane-associated phospholipid phosphatase
MAIIVHPTKADKAIAAAVARNTNPSAERIAEVLTWGADEHVLCAAAAVWWLYCRDKRAEVRVTSNHLLMTTLAATVLPHLMKHLFTQERPDRWSVEAHIHGAPFSGSPLQAFPSGHALHVGALASAATKLRGPPRALAWAAGALLVFTRIFLLAHWASDVVAGLFVGAVLERAIRPLSGYNRQAEGPTQATK